LVTIRGSKADQDAKASLSPLAGIEAGPTFRRSTRRHGAWIETNRPISANIIKAYAGRAGFDASTFSGHSLRSGFLTSAGGKGASISR